MAKTITMADARREAMRGRFDYKTLQKPQTVEPEAFPLIEDNNDQIALEKVSEALVSVSDAVATLRASSDRQATALARAIETAGEAMKAAPAATQWIFRITERDRTGNILEFTATKE